ncbi:hypothetical protein ABZ119_01155 [Streptomyces sp. NPDC006288]|uniref:hypothetical protein n=1 Tax=Streptomyces sp. NPDC006288 TaxID=3156743 RepID=UPI0033A79C7A
MEQPRQAVNRITLGVVGVALALGGVLLAGTASSVGSGLPDGWPTAPEGSTLADRAFLADLRTSGWWTPAVIATTVVLTLLLARWFLGQCGSTRPRRLRLPAPGGVLHLDALNDVLAERTASLAGVARCRVLVRARGTRLYVHTHIWLHPGTAPVAVQDALSAVLTEARDAALPYSVVGRTRISATSHKIAHIR